MRVTELMQRKMSLQAQAGGSGSEAPCVMVIFGASGDLTRRKLIPALYHLYYDGLLEEKFRIVGFARSKKTTNEFRQDLEQALHQYADQLPFEQEVWKQFSDRIQYVSGQYDEPDDYRRLDAFLRDSIGGCVYGQRLFYLALPPGVSETVFMMMEQTGITTPAEGGVKPRIMIEKPFGHDVISARRMNSLLLRMFDENQVYRIDHYLAKDTVRNLLVFRFTNAIFESLWNRNHIDNVQITAAEEIGIEDRSSYYEQSGVVRDMIQNHVLQVLGLVAMDPPLAGDVESVRDKRIEIFKSLAPIQQKDFVFGQYQGYCNETGVAAGSRTPTFAAARLFIDNWRWQGVPFYIRSGKKLASKRTEIVIQFKTVPLCVLPDENMCGLVKPNKLTIRIQPDEGIRLSFMTQKPGREDRLTQTDLDFSYSESGWTISEGYERVLLDGLRGTPALFWRSDGVEAAWEAVAPMIHKRSTMDPDAVALYSPGSWGPDAANDLLLQDGRYWL